MTPIARQVSRSCQDHSRFCCRREGVGGGVVLRKTSVPLIVSPWLNSLCGMARNSGLEIFHIQKIAHWMHWISFKGHLKKIYSGGKKLNLTWIGRKPYKTNKSCNVCVHVFYVHKTLNVPCEQPYSTFINSPIHLNERIKETSTGAPFIKFRRNVLY